MFWKKKMNEWGEIIIKCPYGHGEMRKIIKEDIIIDVCDTCKGMWLDDKEIDKLVALAARQASLAKQKTTQKGGTHRKKTGKKL